ncbi:MAG TPA: response regulator transcription factor [Terriglobales bacterium]|jgi:DNA-binding NarL/FixJ family response regulator|nr:response regulator transcription factor [Terriglobales bacterium]
MTHARVLIADDLMTVLTTVAELLQDSFDVVGMVSDGRTALETTLELKPDLAVLDISMPGMTGIEVARELRSRGNIAKVVFLTVHENPNIVTTCLAAGGLGYVMKDLMGTDLIPAMNEALAGRVFLSRRSSKQETPSTETSDPQ